MLKAVTGFTEAQDLLNTFLTLIYKGSSKRPTGADMTAAIPRGIQTEVATPAMFISHFYIMVMALTCNHVRDAVLGSRLTQAPTRCLLEGMWLGGGSGITDNGVCQICIMKETKNQQSTKTL